MALRLNFGPPSINTPYAAGISYFYSLTWFRPLNDLDQNPNDLALWTESFSETGADGNGYSTFVADASLHPATQIRISCALLLKGQPWKCDQLQKWFGGIVNADANVSFDSYLRNESRQTFGEISEGEENPALGDISISEDPPKWWGRRVPADSVVTDSPEGGVTMALLGERFKGGGSTDLESWVLLTKGAGSTVGGQAVKMSITDVARTYALQWRNYLWMKWLPLPPNNINLGAPPTAADSWKELLKAALSSNLSYGITWNWVDGVGWLPYGSCVNRSWRWISFSIDDPAARVTLADWDWPAGCRVQDGLVVEQV